MSTHRHLRSQCHLAPMQHFICSACGERVDAASEQDLVDAMEAAIDDLVAEHSKCKTLERERDEAEEAEAKAQAERDEWRAKAEYARGKVWEAKEELAEKGGGMLVPMQTPQGTTILINPANIEVAEPGNRGVKVVIHLRFTSGGGNTVYLCDEADIEGQALTSQVAVELFLAMLGGQR